jgi:hypothetical protein
MSRWYQARMVSGLATQATFSRDLRPSRLVISASVHRSASLGSRGRGIVSLGLLVSPHGPASPVGTAAAAHVCATVPNFLNLEFQYAEVPWRAELIDPPEKIVGSAMPLSERPGFGITINERTARKYTPHTNLAGMKNASILHTLICLIIHSVVGLWATENFGRSSRASRPASF